MSLPEDDGHNGNDKITDNFRELLRVDVRIRDLLLWAKVLHRELGVGLDDGLLAADDGRSCAAGGGEGFGVVVVDS